MNVSIERLGAVLVIRPEGGDTLDGACAGDVKRRVLAAIDGGCDVVVDLGALEFVDSAGLGVMVSVFKAVRRYGRRAVFARTRPALRRIMRIIQLDRIFVLADDVDAALAILAPEPIAAAD